MRRKTVVVLNKYDEYMGETTMKRAVRKIVNGRAESVVDSKRQLSPSMNAPLVIRMKHFDYYKYKSERVPYSDRQVYMRDKNTCQYWHDYELVDDDKGKKVHVPAERHKHRCSPDERTIDHVTPTSRGGKKSDFSNVVCCCRYCNEILKRDSTPKEAGLHLIKKPDKPKRIKGDVARAIFLYDESNPSHKAYAELYPKAALG